MKLIDKDALVAEIERRKKELIELSNDFTNQWACGSLDNILSFLDTLEVKDVDLKEELDKYTTNNFLALEGNSESPYLVEKDDMLKIAKYFFELGLKAQKG